MKINCPCQCSKKITKWMNEEKSLYFGTHSSFYHSKECLDRIQLATRWVAIYLSMKISSVYESPTGREFWLDAVLFMDGFVSKTDLMNTPESPNFWNNYNDKISLQYISIVLSDKVSFRALKITQNTFSIMDMQAITYIFERIFDNELKDIPATAKYLLGIPV